MKSLIEEIQEELNFEFKDPEEEYNEAIAVRAKVKRLYENPEYQWLTAIMQTNLDGRVNDIFKPITSLDVMIANVAKQAEIRGFQQAMLFAQSLLNGAQGTIEKFEPMFKKEGSE